MPWKFPSGFKINFSAQRVKPEQAKQNESELIERMQTWKRKT
jgi:hypothetical protein